MTMLRNSTLKQLKRINKEIKKQGGQTDRASDSERNFANGLWVHDPVDANNSGKRKIATYEDMYSIDIPDPTEKELKMKKENMKTIKSFDQINENGTNDTPNEIMRNMKTIRNWTDYENLNAKKERNINIAGKYIETKSVKGYVNRIEGKNVYIESIEGKGVVKVSLKEAIKGYKPNKEKEIKGNISTEGPSNKSVASAPKEDKKSIAPKIDGKSTKTKDNKISKKIYKEGKIKKVSDFEGPKGK